MASWRPRLPAGGDVRIATRLPVVWSSRVLAPINPFVLLGATLLVPVFMISERPQALAAATPVMLPLLFLSLRTQESARLDALPVRAEMMVFVIHVTSFALAGAAIVTALGGWWAASWDKALALGWLTLMISAILQAGRCTSAIAAFAGILAPVLVVVIALAAEDSGFLTPAREMHVLGGASLPIAAIAAWVSRSERSATLRKLSLSALLALAPVPGVTLTLAMLNPMGDNLGPGIVAIAVTAGALGMFGTLYATENVRRQVASLR